MGCPRCDHVGVPPILLIPSASAELELLSLHHAQEVAIATPHSAPSAPSAASAASASSSRSEGVRAVRLAPPEAVLVALLALPLEVLRAGWLVRMLYWAPACPARM